MTSKLCTHSFKEVKPGTWRCGYCDLSYTPSMNCLGFIDHIRQLAKEAIENNDSSNAFDTLREIRDLIKREVE